MTINHPDDAEPIRPIPDDWERTWAEYEGMVMYALPEGDYAVVWTGDSPSMIVGRGSLSLEVGPLEWYEIENLREFSSDERAALDDTLEQLAVDRIAPYTFPKSESEDPGEVLDLDGQFLAVEYDSESVFDELYEALPESSSLSRSELQDILEQVHGRFLISANLEFE